MAVNIVDTFSSEEEELFEARMNRMRNGYLSHTNTEVPDMWVELANATKYTTIRPFESASLNELDQVLTGVGSFPSTGLEGGSLPSGINGDNLNVSLSGSSITTGMTSEDINNYKNKYIFKAVPGNKRSEYLHKVAEEHGLIMNKVRGLQFSRDYFYVNRPANEVDSGGYYRSYFIWTRPNLRAVKRVGGILGPVPEMLNYPDLLQHTMSNLPLFAELCRDDCGKSNMFMLLSNYTKEVPPIRFSETDRESVKNMHGVSNPMPGVPNRNNISVSVTFSDNARGDISNLFEYIEKYKYYTSKEGYLVNSGYIKNRAIDFLMSGYMIVVDPNWNIISFTTLTNMTVTEASHHSGQHKADGFSKQELLDDFTITFNVQTVVHQNYEAMDNFNELTNFNPYNIIDTRGSSPILQVPARAKGSSVSGYIDRPPLMKVGESAIFNRPAFNKYPDIASPIQHIYGKRRFKNIFEYLSKSIGVYIGVNANEQNKPMFKLGFSY